MNRAILRAPLGDAVEAEPIEIEPGNYQLVRIHMPATDGTYPSVRNVVIAKDGEGRLTIEFPDSGEKAPLEVAGRSVFFQVLEKTPERIFTTIYTAGGGSDGIRGKFYRISSVGGLLSQGNWTLQPRE